MRYEGSFPVTTSAAWPRGDFAFSVDGRRLAAPLQRDPAVVGVWDVALGRLAATVRGNSASVTAVAFSPDGKRLATGAIDRPRKTAVVTIWDLGSGRAVLTFDVGPRRVDSLAFAGDGRKIAAGGAGVTREAPGWVTVWDAENGAVLGAQDRLGLVKYLAFHPDGAWLAIADCGNAKRASLGRRGGYADHAPGASRGQLRGVHPGRPAAGITGLRRQRPPCRRPDRRAGAGAPELRPTARLRRLDATAGLQRRRLAHRRPPVRFSQPLGSRAARSIRRSSPKPDDVAGWLRRSRSFATQGDDTRALAAFETSPRDSDRPSGAVDPAWPGRGHRAPAGGDGLRQGLHGPVRRSDALARLRPRARAVRPET